MFIYEEGGRKADKTGSRRGFAAVYVVFYHAFSKGLIIFGVNFSFLFQFGQEAVIPFFILSGFVIQYAYLKTKDKSFKTFFLKRFLRIYIPLLVVFATNFLLLYLGGIYKFSSTDLWTLLGNLLMLQDFSALKPNVICDPFLGNGPLWSLSYEWWFYMIFFLLLYKLKKNASKFVYITGVIAAITYLFVPNFINRELMYLIIWWIGVEMARKYVNGEDLVVRTLKVSILYLLLCILILFINVILHHDKGSIGLSPYLELRHFVFAFVAIIVAIVWKKIRWIGFKETVGIFKIIAPISFGVYISHLFLIIEAHYLDSVIKNATLRSFFYVAICLAYAYLIERIIYVRFNKWIVSRN